MGPAAVGTPPNVARMYAYGLLAECLLIIPILIPLYVSRGLSATDVFLVQGVFTVGVFVLEIPSGYLGDVLGRRVTLVLAAVFWIVGLSAYALARSFAGFAAAELLLAVGSSLRSGTDAALVYDSLADLGREAEYTRYQGKVELAARLGTAGASVLGGALGAVLLVLPVYVNVGTSVLMLALALGFVEPKRGRPPYANPLRGIGAVVARSVGDRRLLVPMLLMGLMSSVGVIGIWSYLLLFQQNGVGAVATGVVFAAFQLSSGAGAQLAARVEQALGGRRIWWVFPFVGLGLLAIGLAPSVWVCAAVMLLNGLVWGVSLPVMMTRINDLTTSDTRATVISVGNMLGRMLYVVLAPVVGRMADRVSLASAFLTLGATTVVASVAIGVAARAAAGPGIVSPASRDVI